jgi:hypothetical protein
MLAERHIVPKLAIARLEHGHEFVLTPVEEAETGSRFCPHAYVRKLKRSLSSSAKKLVNMPPVHASKNEPPVNERRPEDLQRFREERDELRFRHLARSSQEFAMLGRAIPAREAVDRHIVRRIHEGHHWANTPQDLLNGIVVQSVSAADPMTPASPKVAKLAHGFF